MIKPVSADSQDVEGILPRIFTVKEEVEESSDDFSNDLSVDGLLPGVVGLFEGQLNETQVEVVVAADEKTMLQLYGSRRLGFIPSSSPLLVNGS